MNPINPHARLPRRNFLIGGALAVGGGLALTACSKPEATAPAAPAAAGGTSAAPAAATEVINVGFVNARSGPMAPFAEADEYVLALAQKALESGLAVGGKNYRVNFILKDTQSSPVTASAVTKDLINKDAVDLVITSSTPETINPVADACEAAGVPCISTVAPWEAIYFGRGAKPGAPSPFKWTYHFSFGASDFATMYLEQWANVPTNKKVALLLPNDADGNAIRSVLIPVIEKGGYKAIDGGAYQNGNTNFSSQINLFKKENCQVFNSFPFPPDFPVFWRQAAQQGFAQQAKIVQLAKAGLFEPEMEALGAALGNRIASGAYWHRALPYKSSLTGISCEELAAGYEAKLNKPWSQQVGAQMALLDVAVEALKASGAPKDKAAVAQAISKLSVVTANGKVDFTNGPVPNVAVTGLVGTQWLVAEAGAKFPFKLEVTAKGQFPDVPITAKLQPYSLA